LRGATSYAAYFERHEKCSKSLGKPHASHLAELLYLNGVLCLEEEIS
jgi:hypothetical protein